VPLTGGVRGAGAAGVFDRQPPRAASSASAQTVRFTLADMRIKDGLLAEFDHEVGTTKKLLARLPEHELVWKPHERSMTLGGLGTHLGNIPGWANALLNQSEFDLADAPPNAEAHASAGAILGAFTDATAHARGWMDKTDEEYLAPWTLKRGGHIVFTMPRVAAFRTFIINHMIHHRGQLSVYLRMHNVPVPSIYGPSADEG